MVLNHHLLEENINTTKINHALPSGLNNQKITIIENLSSEEGKMRIYEKPCLCLLYNNLGTKTVNQKERSA